MLAEAERRLCSIRLRPVICVALTHAIEIAARPPTTFPQMARNEVSGQTPEPGELTAPASERGEFRKRRLQPRLIDLAKLAVVQVDEDPGVDPAQQIGIAPPH